MVDGADKITVTFHDGTEATAKVVGTDPKSDVAVIKVENTHYRPLPRGSSSKLKVGELVMAVGSPFGLSQTVTTGIISATERNELGINGENSYESFLQTDAAINPGNSGGPLVDMNGGSSGSTRRSSPAAGATTASASRSRSTWRRNIADKLIKDGKVSRAGIGIALEPLTPALAKQLGLDPKIKGVVVDEVVPGQPGRQGGAEARRRDHRVQREPVASLPAFRLNVAASDIGKSYELTYYREGKEQTTTITPAPTREGRLPHDQETRVARPSGNRSPSRQDRDQRLRPGSPAADARAGQVVRPLERASRGCSSARSRRGAPPRPRGSRRAMVITKVVRDRKIQPIKSVKEFQDLTGKADEIAVFVQGQGPAASGDS